MAEAALANFRGFWSTSGTVDEERIDELQAAREGLGDDDDPTTARILATTAVELGFGDDVDERVALADEALAMARRLDHPATLAYLLRTWELVHRLPWFLDQREAVSSEHYDLAQQLDDPVERFWAVNSYSIVSLESGNAERFFTLVDQVLPAAIATGQRLLEWIGGFVVVNALVIRGEFDQAEALMERTHDVGQEAGMPDAGAVYASHMFEIRRAQGRVDELVDLLVAVQAASPEIEAFRPALGVCYRDLNAATAWSCSRRTRRRVRPLPPQRAVAGVHDHERGDRGVLRRRPGRPAPLRHPPAVAGPDRVDRDLRRSFRGGGAGRVGHDAGLLRGGRGPGRAGSGGAPPLRRTGLDR